MEPQSPSSGPVPAFSPPEARYQRFYRTGFYLLLFAVGILSALLYQEIYISQQVALPVSPSPSPFPTPTVLPIAIPSPTFFVSPTPTVVPKTTLRSTVCPVAFTVPTGRFYVPQAGRFATWNMREGEERFFFLPRAEETNGRYVVVELRVEGEPYVYGNGEVRVQCQDNPNKWNQTDFFSYVLKSGDIINAKLVHTTLWGRDVGVLTYSPTYNTSITDTVYLFATPPTLFHVKPLYLSQYQDMVSDVFKTLEFAPEF